jgi:YidC/Oxa1 family membrane protein insertase
MPIANVLQPLIDVCDEILQFWHGIFGSWGVAIIFLTFTVRLAILPLTFRSVKSMQELQVLQPQIKKIQERYKDDRQRMNQEVMRFYQEHKVNPLSSCFPILLQIPFFISLFYLLRGDAFQRDIEGEESFLFIPDLAQPLTDHPFILALMIVIYIATQVGATLVTAISADKTQQRIMLALPFVFAFIIVSFEAGLIVYWITTNVWTVGQQLLVKKLYPKPELEEAEAEGDGAKPARGKPTAEKAGGETGDTGDGKPQRTKAAAKAGAAGGNGRTAKPPPSPRKKKKRSGRRR